MNTPSPRSAFDAFDAFHVRWCATETHDGPMIDEAVALCGWLVAETDATGQGREFALIAALEHIEHVHEFSNRLDEDLADAADALVFQMNALVNA